MTDFSDLCATIADFANRQDWPSQLVTSFVRYAEQKFNAELRVSRMIAAATNTVTCRCSTLPDDWLESDLVLMAVENQVPGGWKPIRYKSRDEFFKLPDKWALNHYTVEGRTIFFGGTPDETEGKAFQLYYFAEVPIFSDTQPSWIYTKYPSLYLSAALMHAYLHAVGEEDKAAGAKQLTEDGIQKLNSEYLVSKASGSRLTRTRVRSFG
jgi:hypothetical protein